MDPWAPSPIGVGAHLQCTRAGLSAAAPRLFLASRDATRLCYFDSAGFAGAMPSGRPSSACLIMGRIICGPNVLQISSAMPAATS